MTRSKNSNSPFKELKKNIRAEAVKNGIKYAEAIERRNAHTGTRMVDLSPGSARRNPGRMDGWQWRGSTFIPPQKVDNGEFRVDEADDATLVDDEGAYAPHPKDRVVCLMDIARPAKRKAAKDRFELVGRPKGVIALSDDELESVATEEWEALSDDMYEEDVAVQRDAATKTEGWGLRPYAEVLKEAQT
ncbi:hypothetical protein GGF50DRAFT_54460 [Schizophyllum commune]